MLKNLLGWFVRKERRAPVERNFINNLEPENLGVQYFVGKQEVADKLIVSINEINWRV